VPPQLLRSIADKRLLPQLRRLRVDTGGERGQHEYGIRSAALALALVDSMPALCELDIGLGPHKSRAVTRELAKKCGPARARSLRVIWDRWLDDWQAYKLEGLRVSEDEDSPEEEENEGESGGECSLCAIRLLFVWLKCCGLLIRSMRCRNRPLAGADAFCLTMQKSKATATTTTTTRMISFSKATAVTKPTDRVRFAQAWHAVSVALARLRGSERDRFASHVWQIAALSNDSRPSLRPTNQSVRHAPLLEKRSHDRV
jgi:hypothetical protein